MITKSQFSTVCFLIFAMIGCGQTEQESTTKDLESGSDCSDLYRYSTDSSPGFRVQDLPGTLPGVVRDGNGLTWRMPGQVIKHILPLYFPPTPGYIFQGQNLNLSAGGTIRWEADYEAFESNIRWELVSNGNVLHTETVRYEANNVLTGTWYSKPIEVGEGLGNLEVRAYVADIKPNGENAYVQLAWVPSVRIKQIRIYHSNPRDRVQAGDPSCRL